MISGEVTADREAVIHILVKGPAGESTIRAIIDTGFTEFLTLPPDVVDSLGLPYDGLVPMTLAGDIEEEFATYVASVVWDGQLREVLILKADGDALIGMAMLRGFRLTLDGIDGGPVTIARL